MKTAKNKLLGSSQMLQVSIETPHTSHTRLSLSLFHLFSLFFFLQFPNNLIKAKAGDHAVRDDGRPEMICDGLLHFIFPLFTR